MIYNDFLLNNQNWNLIYIDRIVLKLDTIVYQTKWYLYILWKKKWQIDKLYNIVCEWKYGSTRRYVKANI